MLDARVSHLIGSIYERAHEGESLSAVAEPILDEINGAASLIAVADCYGHRFERAEYLLRASSRHLDTIRQYEGEMQATDPVFPFIRCNPDAGLFRSTEHLPRDQLEGGAYSRWFRDRFGSDDWMLAFTPPTRAFSFGMNALPQPARRFTDAERDLFTLLFDHLERAARLRARPIDLASHDTAIMLLSGHGALIAVSIAGEAVLRDADGLDIVAGFVLPTASDAKRAWLALLGSAARAVEEGTSGGTMALPRRSRRRPLIATVEALPRGAGGYYGERGVALVRLVDPQIGPGPQAPARWAIAFRLTPAETRLCASLIRCTGSLREAADELGIAYATARVHLASIFQKTDTTSQAALVGLLTRTAQTSSRA